MKTPISKEEFIEMKAFYERMNKPHTFERQGNSITLKVNGTQFYSATGEGLPINQVGFITKIKHHVLRNNLQETIKPNYTNADDIKYFGYSFVKPGFERECIALDIRSAYWTAALKDGFITNALYEEGNLKDKRVRLASLGSFAKIKWSYGFKNKKEAVKQEIKPQFPHVFFNQANTIAEIMDVCRISVGKDYVFHWTDGIYITSAKALDICKEIIEEYGFTFKEPEIVPIRRTRNSFEVKTKKWVKEGKEGFGAPFFMPC